MQNKPIIHSQSKKLNLLFLSILYFFLSGCTNNDIIIEQSPTINTTRDIQINEIKVDTGIVTETIHINNCGNENSVNQTIERSSEVITYGEEELLIKQALTNKYSQPQSTQTTILVIPPDTNMIYHITWQEEVRTGNVRIKNVDSPYTVHQPIAIQSTIAETIGCSEAVQTSIAPTLPEFPWPPPSPSATAELTLGVQTGDSYTLGDIDLKIATALQENGYDEISYYGVPDGFAIVTRIEQINPFGIPEYSNRWVSELSPISLKKFSINQYLEALFSAPKGYYRIFVFIVTPDLIVQSGTPVSQSEAQAWVVEGANRLPNTIQSLPYTSEYRTTVYVYEFIQSGIGNGANQNIPSSITGKQHLENSRLLYLLEKQP